MEHTKIKKIIDIQLIESEEELEVFECCSCNWRFVGGCQRFSSYGIMSESTDTPKYCPMCSSEINGVIEAE